MRTSFVSLAFVLACVSMVSFAASPEKPVQASRAALVRPQDQNPLVGQRFIDVQSKDANGKTHKLSQYAGKGKWVLLDFWASWCGPCQEEMPNVIDAYNKFHGKGFEIVGISLDEDKDEWLGAVEGWGMPWIQLSDLNGWKCKAAQKYGIDGVPTSFLIGPDGVIEACDLRGDELSEFLSSVLN